MRTFCLYDQPCTLIGQSSHCRCRRSLQTLVWTVIELICSKCISLTKWSVYVQSQATFAQSHQRRLSRWLYNSRIHAHRVYSPIVAAALAQWGVSEITLLLFRSRVTQINQYPLSAGDSILLQGILLTKTRPPSDLHLGLGFGLGRPPPLAATVVRFYR